MENVSNIKFDVTQTGNDLLLSLFHNNEFVLDGTISNAPSRLLTGQIVAGYELASEINVWFDEVLLQYEKVIVNTDEKPDAIQKPFISQNVPNPCSEYTTILFESEVKTAISLNLYNINGKLVYTEDFGLHNSTRKTLRLNTLQFESGVYFYQIQTSEGVLDQSRKLIIMH